MLKTLEDEVRAIAASSACGEQLGQHNGKIHLVHAVAAEALVVHGGDGLVHDHVRLKARLERYRVCESFEIARASGGESVRSSVIRGGMERVDIERRIPRRNHNRNTCCRCRRGEWEWTNVQIVACVSP